MTEEEIKDREYLAVKIRYDRWDLDKYPDNIIGYLKVCGVLNQFDLMAVKNDARYIATNFINWCDSHYRPPTNMMFKAIFLHNLSLENFPDWKEKAAEFGSKMSSHKALKEALLGTTGAARSRYLEESDGDFVSRAFLPIDDMRMNIIYSSKAIDVLRAKYLCNYRDAAKAVIDCNLTLEDLGDDETAKTILTSEFNRTKFINYQNGGGFTVSDVILPTLYSRALNEHDARERKAQLMATFFTAPIKPFTLNGFKYITSRTANVLAFQGISTLWDLMEAVQKDYDFCALSGISPYTAKCIFKYVAYLNGFTAYID